MITGKERALTAFFDVADAFISVTEINTRNECRDYLRMRSLVQDWNRQATMKEFCQRGRTDQRISHAMLSLILYPETWENLLEMHLRIDLATGFIKYPRSSSMLIGIFPNLPDKVKGVCKETLDKSGEEGFKYRRRYLQGDRLNSFKRSWG